MNPLFSIVIPVYNAMPYLDSMIKSVLNQTYHNWELILIDDGSSDSSGAVIDWFSKEYANIIAIHNTKNQGASFSRNHGIDIARGKYISFMDADDEIDPYLLEKVTHVLENTNPHLIVWGLQEIYERKNGAIYYKKVVLPDKLTISAPEDVHRALIYLEYKNIYGYLWNKFYDLKYLRKTQIRHTSLPLLEDSLFNIQYCQSITSLVTIPEPLYFYKKRNNQSLTSKFVPQYFSIHENKIQLLKRQISSWGLESNETDVFLSDLYIRYIYSALERNCHKDSQLTRKEQYIWCQDLFKSSVFKNLVMLQTNHKSLIKRCMHNLVFYEHVIGCLFLARIICFVKKNFSALFITLKG